eukprot:775204_1
MDPFFVTSTVMLFILWLKGVQSNTFPNVQQGLVACYPFDGNPNDIINGNDGIVRSAQLTTDRFGEQSAYSFGNWKYIDISSARNVISNINRISISLWVLPYNFAAYSPMYPVIISGWDGTTKDTGGTYFGLSTFGDWLGSGHAKYRKVQWRMSTPGHCGDVYTNALTIGQWTHIVAVYDGINSISSIYANGQMVDSCNGDLNIIGKTHNYSYIGIGIEAERMTGDYTQSHQWNGKIDDVAIYDRVLNDDEIQRLFDGTTFAPTNPTDVPTTSAPTQNPTLHPTIFTIHPTVFTMNPTIIPTIVPTMDPTINPTFNPTIIPTINPTMIPTINPTMIPTVNPTFNPTFNPTMIPTVVPTFDPTIPPTKDPTLNPSNDPTVYPTMNPTTVPTPLPTFEPSTFPTIHPTTTSPTTVSPTQPTLDPTNNPTFYPSNIYWSVLVGISCLNLNNNIEFIDDVSLNECKYQCVHKYLLCDSITYFYVLDKTGKPRCYLFSDKCDRHSFTDNLPSRNASTYIALNVNTVNNENDALSDCINYPRNWTDVLSELCTSYDNVYCLDNRIIPEKLNNIALHKDTQHGYSANDVCCICGGGIYEFDQISLNPHIGNKLNPELDVCHWSKYIDNMERERSIKFSKFREWNVNEVFTLCESSLYQKKDEFIPYLKLSNSYDADFELLMDATCYSAIYDGTLNVCEDKLNSHDILTLNIHKNTLYLNKKWINASSFSSSFDNITANCYNSTDHDQESNNLILRISGCELLDFEKVILSTTQYPVPYHRDFYVLFGCLIGCVMLILIGVTWKVFIYATGRNWKCQKIYISTEDNDDEDNNHNLEHQPIEPTAPPLYPEEGQRSEAAQLIEMSNQ